MLPECINRLLCLAMICEMHYCMIETCKCTVHAYVAAVAPLIPVSRPCFWGCSIHSHKWHRMDRAHTRGMDRAHTRGNPAKLRSGNRIMGAYGRDISVA